MANNRLLVQSHSNHSPYIHCTTNDCCKVKFSFKSFVIGFACAALSLGAVTYANAAGDKTLKACANKKTGVMRYIAKGKCKKTETSLSWNQMGPQGLPGAAGLAGVNGDSGANGETGKPGPNFYAVDASGKMVGQILGAYSGTFTILVGEKIWNAEKTRYSLGGFTDIGISYYSDSLCTRPFIAPTKDKVVSTQDTYVDSNRDGDSSLYRAYSPSGSVLAWTDRDVYYFNPELTPPSSQCRLMTSSEKISESNSHNLFDMVEIDKPTYTAPLRLVAR